MRFTGKKGFDKAIEIFIFLFIIIVVSTIVLRMFKSEVSNRTSELSDIKQDELQDQTLRNAKTQCQELCADAARNDCSPQSKTAFCAYNVGPLDLDGDLGYSSYNTNILGGVGVCEDKIVCPLLIECTCSEVLNLTNCKEAMCDYWSSIGISPILKNSSGDGVYGIGNCGGGSSDWNTVIPDSCP